MNCLWPPAPAHITLQADDVHVWCADLDLPEALVHELREVLAADETSRAARLSSRRERDRSIAGRGLLRLLLSRYLGGEPGLLRFDYAAHGKPVLVSAGDGPSLSFNIAHADRLALYAITRQRAIGVDVEAVSHDLDHEPIAERFFSPAENARLRSFTAEMRRIAFFTCWTRKEAYVKARGAGLSLPLDQFDVSVMPGEPARLLRTHPDLAEAARWSLRDLAPATGYVAALAVEGHGWRLACWRWTW
jgi:4'-phosphopantetheinyl transferase